MRIARHWLHPRLALPWSLLSATVLVLGCGTQVQGGGEEEEEASDSGGSSNDGLGGDDSGGTGSSSSGGGSGASDAGGSGSGGGDGTGGDPGSGGEGGDSGSGGAGTGGSGTGGGGPDVCDTLITDEGLSCLPQGDLTLTANGNLTAGCSEFGALTIDGAVWTILADPEAGPTVIIADSISVLNTGRISGDHQGFGSGLGPGAGANGIYLYEASPGGSHGGKGGVGYTDPALAAYGAANWPVTHGSGGGEEEITGSGTKVPGGAGGAAILICARTTLTVEAGSEISSRGEGNRIQAGGAGGSLLALTPKLIGAGAFIATGGTTTRDSTCKQTHGGGGGGRIRIYADDRTEWTGTSDVSGGATKNAGLCPGAQGSPGTFGIGALP